MALNLTPNLIEGRHLQTNLLAIERHLTDDHYLRELTPADFILDANALAVQITAAAPQWPALRLPDAVISAVVATWRKPSEWRTGALRLQIRYTSSVAGTAAFTIAYRVRAIRGGEVLPGTLLTADPVTLSLAGPAVADTEMVDAYRYTTISFGSDDERFALQIIRSGGDANNNPFDLLSVEVVHIPAIQEAT